MPSGRFIPAGGVIPAGGATPGLGPFGLADAVLAMEKAETQTVVAIIIIFIKLISQSPQLLKSSTKRIFTTIDLTPPTPRGKQSSASTVF